MNSNAILQRDDIMEFITRLYDGDLHAKRVLSLANAALGVLTSASLAIHAVGQGLAQALGKLGKHGVKQVDRLLSNRGIVVEECEGGAAHGGAVGEAQWSHAHVARCEGDRQSSDAGGDGGVCPRQGDEGAVVSGGE